MASRARRYESNVPAGAALAASLDPGAIVFEGSGACIPPVEVDRTVCILGAGPAEPFAEYRLARADLVLAAEGAAAAPAGAVPFELRAEPLEPVPEGARVAVFTTGGTRVDGSSGAGARRPPNLARRSVLAGELDRAAAEGCDVYLTELKAAAIDMVALRARAEGARVVFIRNRPIGVDDALVKLFRRCLRRPSSYKGHGLPYSKGLMAQSISATGLSLERAFELARMIEQRLDASGGGEIDIEALYSLAEEVLTRRGRRGHRAPLPQLAAPRQARPPARRADRRHDRRGQVDDRDDARREARRQPRYRDGCDSAGAPGILHP